MDEKKVSDLIRAAKAISVALYCDSTQGGDLAKRLHDANPMCVNALNDALQAIAE